MLAWLISLFSVRGSGPDALRGGLDDEDEDDEDDEDEWDM